MTKQETTTENLKFYSKSAIGFATFLGGPLAAGYLIRANYISLNEPKKGKNALIIGIVSTVLMFGGIFSIPENIIDKFPSTIIPAIYTVIILLIVNNIHGKILEKHKELGYSFYSNWKTAAVGFISLAVILIGVFAYAYLSPEERELEMYNTELDKFSINEEQSLVFYDHLDTYAINSLLRELDHSTLPKWKENIAIVKRTSKIKNLPTELIKQNEILLVYSELRVKLFQLYKKALLENTDKYNSELDKIHVAIENELKLLN